MPRSPGSLAERAIAASLLIVAIVHAVPALAFFDSGQLDALYGIGPIDANLEVLLTHRAMLFAIVAGVLTLGGLKPRYRPLALAVGWLSVLSFIYQGTTASAINPLIDRVVRVDMALVVFLGIATTLCVLVDRRRTD